MPHTGKDRPSTGRNGRTARTLSSPIHSLEDEIYVLRRKMEMTYLEEASFSADRVIELSRKLDIKINEYMRYKQLCSNG
ncbi:aspartyl-phosphate phosphatase Spo0E family protein [Paenibacillus sambharensis]|uniref:Aspartyl-phosphate phosphatase Spo0E family protein n=1 Tax=Paenibacillus sambharensis TaxID=1803190 RepID=A0A2W1LAD6_9BACL|nr:aspartyl-phosphate phosphatase Spo0E family protein [Paenibacillus sambharensis]PZD95100.1 aspartyl-phosphate phosphatase Spo0E family protein [Paenibacillus sambharensis]